MKLPLLLLTALLASCAPKVGKFIAPPVERPVAVAPSVKKITPSIDRASDDNAEARAHIVELKREVEQSNTATRKAENDLAALHRKGSANAAELEYLQLSWKNVSEYCAKLEVRAQALDSTLTRQSAELKAAKQAAIDALAQAAASDNAAISQEAYLRAAIAHSEQADAANTKLIASVSAAETKRDFYARWLRWSVLAMAGYVGLRLLKLYPTTRAFFFWVP